MSLCVIELSPFFDINFYSWNLDCQTVWLFWNRNMLAMTYFAEWSLKRMALLHTAVLRSGHFRLGQCATVPSVHTLPWWSPPPRSMIQLAASWVRVTNGLRRRHMHHRATLPLCPFSPHSSHAASFSGARWHKEKALFLGQEETPPSIWPCWHFGNTPTCRISRHISVVQDT